jgi:sugar phosphate isomerase/epimerase
MIRPAVITDEITQEFERALDVMLEYGVRDAELRGLWGTNIMDLSPEQLARAKGALDERGMRVCGIASPLYKCDLQPRERGGEKGPLHLAVERSLDEQLTLLEHAIELARYFDTNLIRIFAFWKQGELTDELLGRIVNALRPAASRAERAGVVLGLENEGACMLGTGAETVRALKAIDSPALRCVWDPGNAFFSGETAYPDGYRAVRPYVTHVHVKDGRRDGPDGKPYWVVVGEGEIDYRGQIAALMEDGYTGLMSLETHYKAPGGDPEESSRQCLEGLLRLLREASARSTD